MPDNDKTNLSVASFITPPTCHTWKLSGRSALVNIASCVCLSRRESGPSCEDRETRVIGLRRCSVRRDTTSSECKARDPGSLEGVSVRAPSALHLHCFCALPECPCRFTQRILWHRGNAM